MIGVFGEGISDWGLALWFTADNGWLEDLRPVDLLKTEPERVVQAAEREVEESPRREPRLDQPQPMAGEDRGTGSPRGGIAPSQVRWPSDGCGRGGDYVLR